MGWSSGLASAVLGPRGGARRPKVMADKNGDITGLFHGVMPCGELQVRGFGQAKKPPLSYCTSSHTPPSPHGPATVGSGGDGDGDARTGIGTMRNRDNSCTSLVPLATASSRSGEKRESSTSGLWGRRALSIDVRPVATSASQANSLHSTGPGRLHVQVHLPHLVLRRLGSSCTAACKSEAAAGPCRR